MDAVTGSVMSARRTSDQWAKMATMGTTDIKDPYEGLFDSDTDIEKAVRKRIICWTFGL